MSRPGTARGAQGIDDDQHVDTLLQERTSQGGRKPAHATGIATMLPDSEKNALRRHMNCLPGYRLGLPHQRRLVITENTAKYHFRNILDKLHAQNRAQVIAFAVRHDMVEPQ